MKKRSWLVLPLLLLLPVACSALSMPNVAAPDASSPPEETLPAEETLTEGVVVPAQQSTLAFLVPGTVSELSVAEGDLVQAGDLLVSLATPDLDSAVFASQAAHEAAIADLQYWLVPRKHKPPERRWLAEDRVVAAEVVISTALAIQSQQNLYAPYTASVVTVNVAQGQAINPQQPVLLLADLKKLRIETTDLSEREVVSLQIGQPVLVQVEALNGEFSGAVSAISTMPDDSGTDVFYTVTIELDEIPAALRWGMSAKIDFDPE